MAVINTPWETRQRVSPTSAPVVTAGEDAGEGVPATDAATPAAAERAEKPMVVYVTNGEPVDKIEKVVLMDDKVAIGIKFFTTIKMSPEDVSKDPLLASEGKEVPRLLIVSPDYKNVEVLEGNKIGVGSMYKALMAEAKRSLVGDFDKTVKEIRDLMNEWDKIAKEKSVLDDKKAREDKPTPAEIKKMDAAFAELEARQKKADDRKAELMKITLKGAPAAAA
jgi:hypothetical protein